MLAGDLSLVGPRPEVPAYVEKYLPEWKEVFNAQPGITDLATLQFRDEESVLAGAHDQQRAYLEIVVPIKIQLALEYVRNRSMILDLKILFLTVWGITLGRFIANPDNHLAEEASRKVMELTSLETNS